MPGDVDFFAYLFASQLYDKGFTILMIVRLSFHTSYQRTSPERCYSSEGSYTGFDSQPLRML